MELCSSHAAAIDGNRASSSHYSVFKCLRVKSFHGDGLSVFFSVISEVLLRKTGIRSIVASRVSIGVG